MSELRLALFLISAGFLAGLTWWEWRRPRHSHAGDGARHTPREAELPPPAPARGASESTLLLPEIRAHEPLGRHDLPVVELRPEAPAATMHSPAIPEPPPAPPEPLAHATAAAPDQLRAGSSLDAGKDVDADLELDADAELEGDDELDADDEVDADDDLAVDDELAAGTEQPLAAVTVTTADPAPREELPRLPPAPSPVVEWPPDAERRIVSLRLVATAPERFVGRSLRQALAAEGFVLGRFAIFHKPDEEQRAVLSAASLTRPGTFDADTMDSQHFGGLSLFAVLPGPRPASQAFEELISTARNLNDRLQGALQDERGSPLTTARIALLRERVNSGAPA